MVIALLYFLEILINQNYQSRFGPHFYWLWPAPTAFSHWIQNLPWGWACSECMLSDKVNPWPMTSTLQDMPFTGFNYSSVTLSLESHVKYPRANVPEVTNTVLVHQDLLSLSYSFSHLKWGDERLFHETHLFSSFCVLLHLINYISMLRKKCVIITESLRDVGVIKEKCICP